MKRREVLEGLVERVDYPNKGILTAEGRKVTVKNTIPGQKIRFRVLRTREGDAAGNLVEVLEKSPLETCPKACAIYPACGGCLYQQVPYDRQLALKEDQVRRLLEPYFDDDTVFEGIKASPHAFAYRNKMEFSFGNEVKDGPMTLGMHRRASTYDVLTADTCQLVHEDLRKVLRLTLDYCTARGLTPYNKISHTGFMRYLLLRRAEMTGEILICLVTTTENDHDFAAWADEIKGLELEGCLAGILHACCDGYADNVAADSYRILEGRDWITEKLLGLEFKISLFSFFQTNSAGAEVLYRTVRDYVGEDRNQVLYDLYCGTGTIAQLMADRAGRVYGIELVEEAVAAAEENAARNGIDNCTFLAGDVLKMLGDIKEKPDFIILDPPREGIVPKALSQIIAYGVPRMVYVSCKASSLARDLQTLTRFGYRVERCTLVDMFPHTQHVETVVLLSRKNRHIHRI